ncbi:MAG: hypothetical protein WDZ49_05035 [Litorilinea sp.]
MQQNFWQRVNDRLTRPTQAPGARLPISGWRISGWLVVMLVAALALLQPASVAVWASVPVAELARAPQAMPAQQNDEDEENAEDSEAATDESDDESTDTESEEETGPTEDVTAEDDETIPLVQELGLALDKSFTGYLDPDDSDELSADDIISYTFVITNTGNVTVNSLVLEDAALDLDAAECGSDSLAPTDAATCVYTYTVTVDDIGAGQLENEAIVVAIGPDDTEITATATTTIVLPQLPGLSLEKSFGGYLDVDEDDALGLADIITYTFTITNIGNVALESIALDDALLDLTGAACGESTLEPGEVTDCEHPYTVTQDDMDAGEVVNAASVTGTVVIASPEP